MEEVRVEDEVAVGSEVEVELRMQMRVYDGGKDGRWNWGRGAERKWDGGEGRV